MIVSQVKEQEGSVGYNPQDDKLEDLIAAGVIDPTKVVPFCAAERCVDCVATAYHRGAGCGNP